MEFLPVTVIVPLYNEEKYIENFILSLTKQTYPAENMEWILVDGNSTDRTKINAKRTFFRCFDPKKVLFLEYGIKFPESRFQPRVPVLPSG